MPDRAFLRAALAATLLFSAATVAPPLLAQGIIGSAHDFSSTGWGWTFMSGADDEICLPCHTPHNAIANPDGPLWNHDVTTATFAVYSTPSVDATIGQPGGHSLLCLSCHDGTVALDSWGGQTGTVYWPPGHRDVMGTNLMNDHPISFTYDVALAVVDGELHDPSSTASGLGGTIQADLLVADRLECSSCHDVHDAHGRDKLLRVDNGGSAFCLTCHNK